LLFLVVNIDHRLCWCHSSRNAAWSASTSRVLWYHMVCTALRNGLRQYEHMLMPPQTHALMAVANSHSQP